MRAMADLNALSLDATYRELSRTGLVRRVLELARDEDLGPAGDVTAKACFPPGAAEKPCRAVVVMKSDGVVAGLAAAGELCDVFAGAVGGRVTVEVKVRDGERVHPRAGPGGRATIATLSGPIGAVLGVERSLLNLVGRLSGIATLTGEYVAAAGRTPGGATARAKVFDTRKTTPGLRVLEKYAVRCGGGHCYRIGLYDAVLIKDNHIAHVPDGALATFVREASERARSTARREGRELAFVELEVDRLEQLEAVLGAGGCGVGIVLLDNMPPDRLRRAVEMRNRSGLAVELEASGGVTLDTIGAIAATGVERISVGALTHHAVSADVGLDVE
jgi:nicotinate-nucleotide pyrophosphorylase (carboxylating)